MFAITIPVMPEDHNRHEDRIGHLIPAPSEAWQGPDPALVGDRLAVLLAIARDRIALPLARAAQRFVTAKTWFEFGYARLDDHARERFRRSGRWARDLAALGEAAERL